MTRTGAMARVVGKLRWSLAQRGVWGTLRTLGARMLGSKASSGPPVHPFDVEHGVETSGYIGGGMLAAGHAHGVYSTAYFAVPPSRFRRMMERWRATPGVLPIEQYAFLDVGSGKGRTLLLASGMGLREVAGVELNPELAAVAEANLRMWNNAGRVKTAATQVMCGDATEVELPGGPLLVYFYNPFQAPVLRKLLHKLAARADGARLEVLYLFPKEEAVFAEFPGFERLWHEGIGLDPGDTGVDEISAPEDPCSLYRRAD